MKMEGVIWVDDEGIFEGNKCAIKLRYEPTRAGYWHTSVWTNYDIAYLCGKSLRSERYWAKAL